MKRSKVSIQLTDNKLSPELKEKMWHIYQQYYQLSKAAFLDRFHSSNHYALYRVNDKLVGFSGIRIHEAPINGKSILLVWCGHAAILKAYRGKRWFTRMGFLLVRKYWKPLIQGRIWFWTGALSYRSYLIFAKSMQEYYPNTQEKMPAIAEYIRDYIGEFYYGDQYLSESGTIQRKSQFVLDQSVKIKAKDLSDPAIAYFNKANPLWREGHGLITFAPVTNLNMLSIALKGMKKRWKKRLDSLFYVPLRLSPVPIRTNP